jgi:hypothetical protein
LAREGLNLIKTAAHVCEIETIWIGGTDTTDIAHDLKMLLENVRISPSVSCLLSLPGLLILTNKNAYFKYPFEITPFFCEAQK